LKVGTRSLSSGAHSRDPVAQPALRSEAYERHPFPILSRSGADHRRRSRPRHFLCSGEDPVGRRRAGIASTSGTAIGGLVHVVAGGIGVSAIILAAHSFSPHSNSPARSIWCGSASEHFAKRATCRESQPALSEPSAPSLKGSRSRRSIRKTAAFFLAFIPQFLDPAAPDPALRFMALGLISVTLNTLPMSSWCS